MADAIEKGRENEVTIAGAQAGELSHGDCEKIVGGAPSISEIVVTKDTDISTTKL